MLYLALMWTPIFCAAAGAWMWYGAIVFVHLLMALGFMVTGLTFNTASRFAMSSVSTAVRLKEVQGRSFAVVRFSGIANRTNLQRRTEQLRAFIKAKNLNAISEPVYAFYNSPWTLSFLRRNEVLIEISS